MLATVFTLALALKCYPLQPGGLLAIQSLFLGLTNPYTLMHEVENNLEVILLLVFMVAGIYFMKNLMLAIFTRLFLQIESKVLLSLLFCFVAAFLRTACSALAERNWEMASSPESADIRSPSNARASASSNSCRRTLRVTWRSFKALALCNTKCSHLSEIKLSKSLSAVFNFATWTGQLWFHSASLGLSPKQSLLVPLRYLLLPSRPRLLRFQGVCLHEGSSIKATHHST